MGNEGFESLKIIASLLLPKIVGRRFFGHSGFTKLKTFGSDMTGR